MKQQEKKDWTAPKLTVHGDVARITLRQIKVQQGNQEGNGWSLISC